MAALLKCVTKVYGATKRTPKERVFWTLPIGSYPLQGEAHEITLSYYTEMEETGDQTIFFEVNILDFFKPQNDRNNPRLCIGFREMVNKDKAPNYVNTN